MNVDGNSFYSDPDSGKLQYTLPALNELFEIDIDELNQYNKLDLEISVLTNSNGFEVGIFQLTCSIDGFCNIPYQRTFTPILKHLSPPVVYFGLQVGAFVDIQNTQSLRNIGKEPPFIEARFDRSIANFNNYYDSNSKLDDNQINQIYIDAGDQPPSDNSNFNIKFISGNALHDLSTTRVCALDGVTCYESKTVLKIDQISKNQGYYTGGQLLTINGYGLKGTQSSSVLIDGVPCQIKSQTMTQLTCVTGNKGSTSVTGVNQPGQNGLRRKFYINTTEDLVSFDTLTSQNLTEETLLLHFEPHINLQDNYGQVISGYFKAPATTRYRFYVSGDDQTKLYLSLANKDPSQKQLIASQVENSDYRNYYSHSTQISQWFTLTKDDYYYIEAWHIEGTLGDHITVSVEVEQSSVLGHINSLKEIQRLQINPNNIREITEIIIEYPDNGKLQIKITSPKGVVFTSPEFPSRATRWDLYLALYSYYIQNFKADILITRTMYNTDGTVTNNASLSIKNVYTVTLQRQIKGVSSIGFSFIQKESTAFLSGQIIQQSSLPLSGTFVITGTSLLDGVTTCSTPEISYNSYKSVILQKIQESCPEYRNIEVWEGTTYNSFDDGRDIYLRFSDFSQDIPQFYISEGIITPLQGNQFVLDSITDVSFSSNVFYQPIPFEFIFTNEINPQVIVEIDGLPAVCHSLKCDYSYVQVQSDISSFTLNGLQLTISGTNLPTTTLESITYATIDCLNPQLSSNQIICTLASSPVAGSQWTPRVREQNGFIPVSAQPQIVGLNVVSINGIQSDINPNGNNIIEIIGANFPSSLKDDPIFVSVTFEESTQCVVKSVSRTKIICKTKQLTNVNQNQIITINVNGEINTSYSAFISTSPASISDISPNSVSPVLKSKIDISILGFSPTLNREDFTVFIVNSDESVLKEARVISVDDANKQIKIAFGGAPSNTYKVEVSHVLYGKFDSSQITLKTQGVITSFYPNTGSVYGGTKLTITGHTFSNDMLENNVRVGQTDCLVLSSTPTEIQCRLQTKVEFGIANSQDVLVFLKAAEEAVCEAGPGQCKFQWINQNLPTLYQMYTQYDAINGYYKMIIQGDSLYGTPSDYELFIDNQLQNILSVSSTIIEAQITGLVNMNTTQVQLFSPIGTCPGYGVLKYGLPLQPKLTQISPYIGSPAGSLIYATIKGLGSQVSEISLVNSLGASICSYIEYISFEYIKCKTNAITISSPTQISVKKGNQIYACVNTDLSKCQYQTDSLSMPLIQLASISSDRKQISFIGDHFFMSGWTTKVTYNGYLASSVQYLDLNTFDAIFTNGVPISKAVSVPIVQFESQSSDEAHIAQGSQGFSNLIQITSSSQNLQCSFAGGCQLQIDAEGLATTLTNNYDTAIYLCNRLCEIDWTLSSSSQVTCNIPQMPTLYSVFNYHISNVGLIKPTSVFYSNPDGSYVFDGNNLKGWENQVSNCYFGVNFTQGSIGVISEVRIYMNRFIKANYIGKLSFQGSNDEWATKSTIFTVGEEIHEGWNYYEFPEGQEKVFSSFRFFGSGTGSCIVGEVKFKGVEVKNDNNPTFQCTPKVFILPDYYDLSNSVTYSSSLTPLLTSISPRWGSVKGGETLTLTGQNLDSDYLKYTIKIDSTICAPIEATSTYVKCITGQRPGLYDEPTLEIYIQGIGNVATQGIVFRYANYWSDSETWGGDFQPVENESVFVPKGLILLVDIDSTPVLDSVLVEGGIIFPSDSDQSHLREFKAHYIFVKGGFMEVGTEEFPYTSNLIITIYGTKYSPEIPIYGNKVLAVRQGVLDLHGVKRTPTWTELDTTAEAGSTQISLIEAVDWKVGETIVIAPSGFFPDEAETRIIQTIDGTKKIITFDKPLEYKHYSGIQQYGTDSIEMRSEVALLSRNVIIRGDPETTAETQHGAHIMLHSRGDDSLKGRIEYIEMKDVGQAFELGRYPIHFHMIGATHDSYIIGNSLHQTYNRAITMHGVHFLRIKENVAYDTKGHTFFIEDAIETKNLIEHNLAIQTMRSWSLLNTDNAPASFWITNPDNMFRNNHAAGSDRYGFWFDLQEHPTGPSFDPNICPINMPLGEFTGNVAHSNVKYGLRVFHGIVSRTKSCLAIDPVSNPPITAYFEHFIGWKNQENGAIFELLGDVRINDFKLADNILAGIEVSLSNVGVNGTLGSTIIDGALIIGYTSNAGNEIVNYINTRGLITPRTEGLQVKNVRFYNFDINNVAALSSCSHCFHPASTDSGARTVTFQGLQFDSTVNNKIRYQFPYNAIFLDLDGTLTGIGPNTWTTPYWKHNDQPECSLDKPVYDGLICDSTVQVRRIAFYNFLPSYLNGLDMKIIQFDDSIINAMSSLQLQTYLNDSSQYSVVRFKPDLDPQNSWTAPYVTKHKYKIHWNDGIDFSRMQLDPSIWWSQNDENLYLSFNFTEKRMKVDFNVTLISGQKVFYENGTLTQNESNSLVAGHNIFFNDTIETQMIHTVINGKLPTKSVLMTPLKCVGSCIRTIVDVPIENTTRLWSDPKSWDYDNIIGHVPLENEDVEIIPGWNMIYDLLDSPLINKLEINGRLTFQQGQDHTLRLKHLFIRAGELIIGTQDEPFNMTAKIVLSGMRNQMGIAYDNAIESGNKVIVNIGTLQMYGQPRVRMTRLTQILYPGNNTINVEGIIDWEIGDKILLLPTASKQRDSDFVTISAIDYNTGTITLSKPLEFYHFGDIVSTGENGAFGGTDMRGEVFLISRNVQIIGEDIDNWGGQIVTSDFDEEDETQRSGITLLDNVEIYNCSQIDTNKAALRFEGAKRQSSLVSNSVIYNGQGRGVQVTNSENIYIQNNLIYFFQSFGVNVQTSNNITLDGNAVVHVNEKLQIMQDEFLYPTAGFSICAEFDPDQCSNIKLINNIAVGAFYAGFVVMGHDCGDANQITFRNNIAHSNEGAGALFFPDASKPVGCWEASYFTAYKNTRQGAFTFNKALEIRFSNMVLIDNGWSINMNMGIEADNLSMKMKNISIYGEAPAKDCDYQYKCLVESPPECRPKRGMMTPYISQGPKPPHINRKMAMPLHNVKNDASWGGVTHFEDVQFIGFKSNLTWCGQDQRIFEQNPTGADYHLPVNFQNVKFIDVHEDAFVFLYDPKLQWAIIDDCGAFPCTGPKNQIMFFKNAVYSGNVTPIFNDPNFQILSHNPQVALAFSQCTFYDYWNAYYCVEEDLSLLLVDSLDLDSMDRTVSPLIVTSPNLLTYSNVLNSFMDHVWDGFYTGHKRKSRFPIVVKGGYAYNLSYTGTPPIKQRFKLAGLTKGITVQIRYTKPMAFDVVTKKEGLIKQNDWDYITLTPGAIKGTRGCGENRFMGVLNIIEFFITPDCELKLLPKDLIQTKIRLDWTLQAFYADGGTTKFSDRLAASLGIHPSTIKVVSVYQGSVILDLIIEATDSSDQASEALKTVKIKLLQLIYQSKLNIGAPILDAYLDNEPITINGGEKQTPSNNSNTSSTDNQVKNQTGPVFIKNPNGTITNNTDQQYIDSQYTIFKKDDNKMLIIVISTVVSVLVLFTVIGFVIYKKCKKSSAVQIQNLSRAIPQDDKVSPDRVDINETEHYDKQYHPKAKLENVIPGKQTKILKMKNYEDLVIPQQEGEDDFAQPIDTSNQLYTTENNDMYQTRQTSQGHDMTPLQEQNSIDMLTTSRVNTKPLNRVSNKTVIEYDDI